MLKKNDKTNSRKCITVNRPIDRQTLLLSSLSYHGLIALTFLVFPSEFLQQVLSSLAISDMHPAFVFAALPCTLEKSGTNIPTTSHTSPACHGSRDHLTPVTRL